MEGWAKFKNDFNAMTDNDIAEESRHMEDQLAEAEEWLEAVAAWGRDGRPRATTPTRDEQSSASEGVGS